MAKEQESVGGSSKTRRRERGAAGFSLLLVQGEVTAIGGPHGSRTPSAPSLFGSFRDMQGLIG